ncbi:hypothetical protein Pmani_004210 [Petrolisthes manimaculis]|uniref:Uncharacterized protein n=1 Tax=Petrolisthes manimaculis TaxID=1843537 RepID=A0AAE1QH66_9EUCA|nr:hypothetical protein Pmani_004210 [Petrolisthes manimaculis]
MRIRWITHARRVQGVDIVALGRRGKRSEGIGKRSGRHETRPDETSKAKDRETGGHQGNGTLAGMISERDEIN